MGCYIVLHTISAQYFHAYRDIEGSNKTVSEYIKQIADNMFYYLHSIDSSTTIAKEDTIDSSLYCIQNKIQPYIIFDGYSQHFIYIFAHPYGVNDQYAKEHCWLILVSVFDDLPPDGKLQNCVHMQRLNLQCGSFPYMGTQSGGDAQAPDPTTEEGADGCPMGYFHVITAININADADLQTMTFIGCGRMFTVLSYQPQRLKGRSTNLLNKPIGYFSYGRFTKWHIEENKRVIFTSSLYSMLGCMIAIPFPKRICSIHFCNEQVYLSPDATSLRDIYWCMAGTDGPGQNTLNISSPQWHKGINFQNMVVPLFRGWCDNRKYWVLPSDSNINTVIGHVSNAPIRKELPVYDSVAVSNDHMTHNNLSEEQKLLQAAKLSREKPSTAQIIYHPYFMVLRQPEILGEYSTVGECELYGEIAALNHSMGDTITIGDTSDEQHRYFVFTFDHTLDGLAFVFEMYAKAKLLKEINKSNFDIRLFQRWRNFDWLEVEYGPISGIERKKVRWTIQEFENSCDSYSTFNFTKDDQYTYNIYQVQGDSLNLTDLTLRESSHTGWIYNIIGYRGKI